MKVPFYRHDLTPDHAAAVARVLGGPMLTSGEVGRAVERQIAAFFGVRHGLLVNSWTNGALAALLALDIGPGDEVIVPAMTFIASANVVEMVGARPVFVDVDPATLLLTPAAAAAAITARTKAVIPVHLYGQMVDMAGLARALAPRGRIAIIEDAAHCFEGSRDGAPPGAHSDAAIFSFYATKNVTCGEGGAIVTNSEALADKLRQTRLHGMSAHAADRHRNRQYAHWDMARLGVKANLPDLLACLLPDQIDTIRARLPARHALARRYRDALAGLPIRLPAAVTGGVGADHIFPIHVPPAVRDDAIAALNEQDIGVAVNYRAPPTLTFYRDKYGYRPTDFPVAQHWGDGTITLPFFPGMSMAEQDWVIRQVADRVAPLCREAAA